MTCSCSSADPNSIQLWGVDHTPSQFWLCCTGVNHLSLLEPPNVLLNKLHSLLKTSGSFLKCLQENQGANNKDKTLRTFRSRQDSSPRQKLFIIITFSSQVQQTEPQTKLSLTQILFCHMSLYFETICFRRIPMKSESDQNWKKVDFRCLTPELLSKSPLLPTLHQCLAFCFPCHKLQRCPGFCFPDCIKAPSV